MTTEDYQMDENENINSEEEYRKRMEEDVYFHNLVLASRSNNDSFNVLCDTVLIIRKELDELKKELGYDG